MFFGRRSCQRRDGNENDPVFGACGSVSSFFASIDTHADPLPVPALALNVPMVLVAPLPSWDETADSARR